MKFIEGNVIGSQYTITEYPYNVPIDKLNIKAFPGYLHNAHKQNFKLIYHYNKNLVIQ